MLKLPVYFKKFLPSSNPLYNKVDDTSNGDNDADWFLGNSWLIKVFFFLR